MLVYLIRHQDRVVTRDELLEHCWPGTFVSESALTQCLTRVRKAVGDHRDGPPLIKTAHGQGYRFVASLLTASAQLPQPSEAHQAPRDIHTPQDGSPLAEHCSLTVLCADVGREAEMAVLRERWEQVKEGMGQVVLIHGESGIGESRLMQRLTEHIAGEPHTRFECRCSPYHQHSAWYPVTDLLTRTLALDREMLLLTTSCASWNSS